MFVWHIDSAVQREPLIIISVFAFLAGLAVIARISARYIQRIPLAANDYVMLASLFITWAICACELVAILLGGIGLHQDHIAATHPQSLTIFGILVFVVQLSWPIAQGLVKVSMCLLYIAVFPQRRFRIISTIVLGICALLSISICLATLLICVPISAWWAPTATVAACGNRASLWLWGGILNVVTDAMVIYLPMPMVWALCIPRGKKLMLTGLFGVGALVTAVSVIRLHCVLMVDFSKDTTYTITHAVTWSFIETSLGICASCLPVMGPAIRYLVPASMAKRWSYARQAPGAGSDESGDSNLRHRISHRVDEESGLPNAARGEKHYYGTPCATRAPTPHPMLSMEKGVAEEVFDSIKVTGSDSEPDPVIDSMVRGEGIMVKVEWEVTSDMRSSWPLSMREKKVLSIATTRPITETEASAESPGASLSLAFPML